MKVGYLLPGPAAVGNRASGVVRMAQQMRLALVRRGTSVEWLLPHDPALTDEVDIVHLFGTGLAQSGSIETLRLRGVPSVLSPVNDSRQPPVLYRSAAAFGELLPRMTSIPAQVVRQLRLANAVVTMSQDERLRVLRFTGVPDDRVHVVLNGTDVPTALPSSAEVKGVCDALALPSDFVLTLSAYSLARKNVTALVEAIGPTGIPLVIAGNPTRNAVAREVETSAHRYSSVKVLPFIPSSSLPALFSAARVFCLPSKCEGAGLAALEAASYGCNIVVTGYGGTREYFGSHAVYLDDLSVEGIRNGVLMAWNSGCRDEGVREFVLRERTWDSTAARLMAVYSLAAHPQ